MTTQLHLLETGIAVLIVIGLVCWAFSAWSRSHQRHLDEVKSGREKYQAWDSRDRNR